MLLQLAKREADKAEVWCSQHEWEVRNGIHQLNWNSTSN